MSHHDHTHDAAHADHAHGHDGHGHPPVLDEALFRLPAASRWGQTWKLLAVLALVGWGGIAVFGLGDVRRFAFSYLFAFVCFMVLGLGALFFVLVQHLTSSGWSVTVRRIAEVTALGLPVLAVLWAPIWLTREHLYEWTTFAEHGAHGGGHGDDHGPAHDDGTHGPDGAHPDEVGGGEGDRHGEVLLGASKARAQEHGGAAGGALAAPHDDVVGGHVPGEGGVTPESELHHELLEHKSAYLNVPFWTARALVYLLVWSLLSILYFRWSTAQDRTKDVALTRRMQRLAPAATVLFGLSLTFAAFDWIMALEPTWYSTIYGVIVFANGAVSILAFLIVVTLSLKDAGFLGEAVNAEHYHDLGKLLFGFIVFWAYVSFSQMMLIWYAGIPEEATYYHNRWNAGGWATYSLALLVGFFVLPFLFLISRVMKRNFVTVRLAASWMLGMTVVNAYWYVLPVYDPGHLRFHLLDLACLLAVGGTFLGVVAFLLQRTPLIPLGDPRLPRALRFENA